MFSQSQTLDYYSRRNIIVWLTMTFQAGAINAGAFLSGGRFVTHTTGLATNFGTELAQGHWPTGIAIGLIPVFYLTGAMASGYLIDNRIQLGKRPLYPVVMGMAFFLLTLGCLNGLLGNFGNFGDGMDIFKHFLLLMDLAFISGLLNGTVTSASGAVIRITHMTGLTTDLGIGIARVLTHSHKINSRGNEIRANLIRFFIFTFFTLGALLSTYLYLRYAYWGFVLPCLLGLILFAWSIARFVQSKPPLSTKPVVSAS